MLHSNVQHILTAFLKSLFSRKLTSHHMETSFWTLGNSSMWITYIFQSNSVHKINQTQFILEVRQQILFKAANTTVSVFKLSIVFFHISLCTPNRLDFIIKSTNVPMNPFCNTCYRHIMRIYK